MDDRKIYMLIRTNNIEGLKRLSSNGYRFTNYHVNLVEEGSHMYILLKEESDKNTQAIWSSYFEHMTTLINGSRI